MRADTWANVTEAASDFVGAFWSRLRCYLPGERERREAADVRMREQIREAINSAMGAWKDEESVKYGTESEDAQHVEVWMAENGFTSRADTYGIDEQTEVAISAATEAFRTRLGEIFGHDDFDFHVEVGLDNEREDS